MKGQPPETVLAAPQRGYESASESSRAYVFMLATSV